MENPNNGGSQEPQKPSDKWNSGKGKIDDMFQFAQNNIWDTVALVVLAIGILLMLVKMFFLGGLIIGVIGGIYFSDAIVTMVKNIRAIIEEEGIVRSLILGGLILGFFIASPGIFIGAVAAIGVKQLISSTEK